MQNLPQKKLRIGLVAGEASGDILAAGLIQQLKVQYPEAVFEGIGGERMCALGMKSFFPMERLSVMGLIEPLKRIFELIKIRRFLVKTFTDNPPDIFIGIDAPDFNLGLESQLKAKGIKTVHYVSPTIWAWRPGRIHKIKKAVDHVLLIFPFESRIYQQHKIGNTYVGHTLAEAIPLALEKNPARESLNLPKNCQIIGILPGSRNKEIKFIAEDFINIAKILVEEDSERVVVAAMANEAQAIMFKEILAVMGNPVPIIIKVNQTREVLQAIDVAMVVSGTATLETALMKRPFIVAYKMSKIGYKIAERLVKLESISLLNIVAGRKVVTEYIQDNINPEIMAKELTLLLNNQQVSKSMVRAFTEVHNELKQNADVKSANAIINLIKD